MRLVGAILIGLMTVAPATAQEDDAGLSALPDGRFMVAAAKRKAKAKTKPAIRQRDDGLSTAERMTVQYELAWTGDFTGAITGEAGEKTTEAIQSFQAARNYKETGVLSAAERAALAAAAKARQERVGWTLVEDAATGAQLGIPTRHVPNRSTGKTGTRWSSAQGQIQVETFRIREPGTTLEAVYEQQRKQPSSRRSDLSLLKDEFFVLGGMQGLKRFHVRAAIKDDEVRGMTVLWDQATAPIMDHVAAAMSGAFVAFPTTALGSSGAALRRKVEYGTGLVVSAAGHIMTDRQVTEGCQAIVVGGHGDAAKLAEGTDLALLRLYGASGLMPAALPTEAGTGSDLTLVGIADPQSQDGGNAVATAAAKLNGDVVTPAPPPGFSGAAALDKEGRLYGLVTLKAPAVAATGSAAAAQATVVPLPAIRAFLDAQKLAPGQGHAGIDAVKAAVVRVICVRK